MRIMDLGSAPGGWSQVAGKLVGEKGRVLATDILPMDPVKNVDFIQGDFTEEAVFNRPEPYPPQKLGGTLTPFLAPRDPMHQQRLAHDGADRDAGVERGVRVLEDDLHLAAIGQHPRRRQAGDVVAGEPDRPRGGLQQPKHRLAEGGFSASRTRRPGPGSRHGRSRRDVVDGEDWPRVRGMPPRRIGKCFFSPATSSNGGPGAGRAVVGSERGMGLVRHALQPSRRPSDRSPSPQRRSGPPAALVA